MPQSCQSEQASGCASRADGMSALSLCLVFLATPVLHAGQYFYGGTTNMLLLLGPQAVFHGACRPAHICLQMAVAQLHGGFWGAMIGMVNGGTGKRFYEIRRGIIAERADPNGRRCWCDPSLEVWNAENSLLSTMRCAVRKRCRQTPLGLSVNVLDARDMAFRSNDVLEVSQPHTSHGYS